MLKALLKKQMMEINAWLFCDKKKGKSRSKLGIAGMLLLYIVIFAFLGMIFFMMADMICPSFVELGMDWFYFAIMGLVSILLGVFGSVFTTYSTMYKAKDNDMLLSMPIPPRKILFIRLFGVWLWSFIYVGIVYVPAIICYFMCSSQADGLTLVAGVVTMLVVSFFVLTLACILGWCVAKISTKLKNRSAVTVIASLVFFCLYYYVYFKAYDMIQMLMVNAVTIGEKIKGKAHIVYVFGKAPTGDMVSLLILAAVTAVLFGAVCFVLSKTFLRIATASSGLTKKSYTHATAKMRSINSALLYKERKRFTSSATYMLNCSMSSLLMVVAGVFLLVKGTWIKDSLFSQLGITDEIPDLILFIIVLGMCAMASMNDITAPSVSLEGKNIWIVQSMPIDPSKVLMSKLKLHLWVTQVPLLFCLVVFVAVFRPGVLETVYIIVIPVIFCVMTAAFGLIINLKMPNLNWTDETVAVKQSMGVLIAMFGGFIVVGIAAVIYYLMRDVINIRIYLAVMAMVFLMITVMCIAWIKIKGAKIFASL